MTVLSLPVATYPTTRTATRTSLRVYFTILIPLVAVFSTLNILGILNDSHALLMVSPAVAAVVTRLLRREGFADISLQFGGRRGLAASVLAVLFPIVAGILVYLPVWFLGAAHFVAQPFFLAKGVTSPTLQLVLWVTTFMLLGAPGLILAIAGEELGWRGFMLTRLIDGGLPKPILLSGLVWSLYHLPIILGGNYSHTSGNVVIAAFLFIFSATTFSYILAWLRLGTGSVWPCIIAHGAWNTIFNIGFAGSNQGGDYIVSESGIITIVVMMLVAVVLWRVFPPRMLLRTPQIPLSDNSMSIQNPVRLSYVGAGIFCILGGLVSLIQINIGAFVALVAVGTTLLLTGHRELVWANLKGFRRAGVVLTVILFLLGTAVYLMQNVTHIKL